MNIDQQTCFNISYPKYLNELKLQGKAERTIENYSRGLRLSLSAIANILDHEDLRMTPMYII
jgi:hypothetical protein